MNLNKFALAISLMLPITTVYAQALPNNCKVDNINGIWKITGFTGNKLAGAMTYTSSNSAVATVNASNGELAIVGLGDTTITVTQAATKKAKGASGSCSLKIVQPTALQWVADKTITYADGTTLNLDVASSASQGAITYMSSDTKVATIDVKGGKASITIKDGTLDPSNGQHTPVVFTARQAANGAYSEMTATFKLTINPADNNITVMSGKGAIVMPSN